MTDTVWHGYVIPGEAARDNGQDEVGRLWDILAMLYRAIKRIKQPTDTIMFEVLMIMKSKPAAPDKV